MDSNSHNLEAIGKAMQAAWQRVKKVQSRMWGDWMAIGEGLLEGRRWAMHQAGTNMPQGKGYVMAFSEWLKRYKVDDMDQSDRAKLLHIMEERAAVEEWRSTLTNNERRNLNNPTLVWRKWQAATRVKPRAPKRGEDGYRHQHEIDMRDERIAELEQELHGARELQTKTAARAEQSQIELAAVKEKPAKGSPLAEADLLLDYLHGRGLSEPEACAVMEIALQALIKVTEEK